MRKNTLKMLGILIVSATLFASVFTGCGSKETDSVQETEQVEAVLETETEEPETEEFETETEEETEELLPEETEMEEPEFTVTDMSATKYAKSSVNVRKGPSSDYEKLGGLSGGQKVTVTGQADTGWYRIEYDGAEGYVSDKYLIDQKQTSSATSGSNATSTSNTTSAGSTGSTDTSNNTNAGSNAGSTGSTNTSGSTSGTTGNAGSSGSTDTNNNTNAGSTNTGSTGSTDTSGSANTGSTDTSGNTDAESAGSTAPAGSVIDPNTGMYIPSDIVIEEDDGSTGADDGTGLSGGTSTWY